ncbi:hypothetical protein L1049_004303 [Liquidambar formosana]|uniref:Uncharacterized protein n=1 Tax=Liquidambar formosana TaxID=63359 RepID=A0AAP0RNT0_LIQFO
MFVLDLLKISWSRTRSFGGLSTVRTANIGISTTPKAGMGLVDLRHHRREISGRSIVERFNPKQASNHQRSFNGDFSFSELWAGPAYSNSPPPSSLPIPKFSLKPKRTVSLDLPVSASDIEMHPIARSAPPSPSRDPYTSPRDFFLSADSATKTLRRILNLDISDEGSTRSVELL